LPKQIVLKEVREESPRVKTFVFDRAVEADPGQFVMLWVPGVNEKPFGVSKTNPFTIRIACVGAFTEKMCDAKPGDKFGYRGPFGKAFELRGKKVLLVAGGYGASPLRLLAEKARQRAMDVTVVQGAKTAADMILQKEFEELGCRTMITTDDGTAGAKGLCTDSACSLLDAEKFDAVYSCGPEKMMKRLGEECVKRGIPCQLSLERYFKCGMGVCGQCAVDGLLVCKDGPVFEAETVLGTKDFGTVRRDASGKKIML